MEAYITGNAKHTYTLNSKKAEEKDRAGSTLQ